MFAAAAEEAQPTTYADVIRCLNASYARSRGKTRYGNKTPKHVLHMPEIAELFPEARFVHIVRDGRDVALSYLSKDFGPSDVRSAADVWRARVERGRADGARLGERRYAELRYEDLLTDPEAELRTICAFLDLPFDDAMLRYHENGPVPSLRRDPNEHLAKPPTKGLRDWPANAPRGHHDVRVHRRSGARCVRLRAVRQHPDTPGRGPPARRPGRGGRARSR